MVIFDSRTMLTGSGNQYLNPDYIRPLSPLPSELDAKSSPLALLAKTCSQIGADPGIPISKKSLGKRSESVACKSVSPVVHSESRAVENRSDDPPSRSASVEIKVTDMTRDDKSSLSSTTSTLSSTISTSSGREEETNDGKKSVTTPSSIESKASTTSSTSSTSPSPIVRSGIEVLSGQSVSAGRDSLYGGYRPPNMHPFLGFPPTSTFPSHLSANPFWSSFMSSAVCRDPLCSDPFCPTSIRNQQLLAAATGRLPSPSSSLSSYSSLLSAAQQREAAALLAAQRAVMAQAAAAVASTAAGVKPYVCNWVSGSDYCGRRFSTSEELLLHLKTHTNFSTSDSRLLGAVPTTASSSTRYHPYARPPVPPPLPSGLGLGSPFVSNPYSSLYSSLFPRPPLL